MTVASTRRWGDARPGLTGVEIDTTVFRPAAFIESAIGNVSLALLVGLLLIAVVLRASSFDWRAAVIALVTIPSLSSPPGWSWSTPGPR